MEIYMNIDILINSCSRPDVLETSILTFKKYIKTSHNLRYIILEDKVNDNKRQKVGRKWLNKNKDLFDEIHLSKKRMGPGFFFAPIVKLCKTDYFFHLEDDNIFFMDIDIDPIVEVMKNNEILEIILRRGITDPRNNPTNIIIDGLELTQFDIFSVATGLFNTSLVEKVIDVAGWKKQLREVQVLGRISKELNLKKYTLGFNNNDKHYEHIGPKKGYKKGGWKSEQ